MIIKITFKETKNDKCFYIINPLFLLFLIKLSKFYRKFTKLN